MLSRRWKKKQLLCSSALLSSTTLLRRTSTPRSLSNAYIQKHHHNPILHPQFSTHRSSSHEIKQTLFPFSFSSPFRNPSLHLTFSSAASTGTVSCWNCNAVASDTTVFLFCDACRSIQPVEHSVDYFRIFGLEKKYEIEGGNLEGKYKDWQKKLHPDLVHSKSKEEREYAAEQSARVTTAYRTLTNPLSRAIYILKLEGIDVDEEERISDPELLSEMMEIREAVEEARDSHTLNQIQEQMQKKMGKWSKSFADAFHGRKYDEAVASIRRMTYYKRAIEEIVKKL